MPHDVSTNSRNSLPQARSLFSRGLIATSDHPQSSVVCLRKSVIAIVCFIILTALAFFATSAWQLLPQARHLDILQIQTSNFFIFIIILGIISSCFMIAFACMSFFMAAKVESQLYLFLFGCLSGGLSCISLLLVISCIAFGSQMDIFVEIDMKHIVLRNYAGENSRQQIRYSYITPNIK